MGVLATFCQLCALPTQHDHYVPTAGGMLKIYRGLEPGGGHTWEAGERPFVFGPQHAWLKDAVALSLLGEAKRFRGPVEDGGLADTTTGENVFVANGDEEALVFHARCWELMGEPRSAGDAPRGPGTFEWSLLSVYQEQLFEFAELAQDGRGWMLADPATDERSRARIASCLEAAKRPALAGPTTLTEVLAADRDWRGITTRDQAHQRRHLVVYRTAPTADFELSAWPHLLCLVKAIEPGFPGAERLAQLERLQRELKAALEHDGLGVTVLTSCGEGQAQYLAYVKDLAEAHARIDPLPGWSEPNPIEHDDAEDPTWTIFFEEMGLPRR